MVDRQTRSEYILYLVPLLISIIFLGNIYRGYYEVSIQHLSNAYCDDSALLMEEETSRYKLKGMSNGRFYFLFSLLIILLVIYLSLFVLKIFNTYNIGLEYFIVPTNWVTFFIIWALIILLIAYMFSYRSIPFMDYNTFSTNVANLFGENEKCSNYSFAPAFDDLPESLIKSIVERYRKKKEKEFPNDKFTDEDLKADLRKELNSTERIKQNIHKYLNIPNDVKLLNDEYAKWVKKTSSNMQNEAEATECLKESGKDPLQIDLVNNSSAYMANIKSLIVITWILIAVIGYPLYSDYNLSKYVQQIALFTLILIGVLLMFYFVMIRSDL